MKVAALDLGTNTFLCLIAEVSNGRVTKVIEDQVEVVRLGQGVDKTKMFHPEALARAQKCLVRFSELIKKHKPEKTLAMATSAARDVTNSQELFKIGTALNIPIEIIPGEKEAEITYAGAASGLAENNELVTVIDVGGGSTELIVGKGKKVIFGKSLDIGCVRLTESFISKQPISNEELTKLTAHIQKSIKAAIIKIKNEGNANKLLAVAGTPTELARIELGEFDPKKIDGYKLSIERLNFWVGAFSQRAPMQTVKDFNINPGRADVILAGALILREICHGFGQKEIEISTRGVRYGVALEIEARER